MKIAINLSGDYLGGITTTNINLMDQLSKSGCFFLGIDLNNRTSFRAPEFYSMFTPRTTLDHRILSTHHLSIKKIVLQAKNLKEVEKYFKVVIQDVQKILKETKPDIMLLSGTYFVPWIISIAAAKEKIPVVLRYAGVSSRETRHWPLRARKIFMAMERSISKRASIIIFPSTLCRDVVFDEVMSGGTKRNYVIPNSVSEIFSKAKFVPSVERRIAAIGRYDDIKNIDAYIKLHKILLRRGWKHTASLITNRNHIPRLPKTIQLLPAMTPKGLKEFYKTTGIIICPSKFETFGNVPMEAACLGIPVLVSDQMGCADILRQAGLNDMITSFDNLEKAADRVMKLCGQYILPKQRLAIKKLLNPDLISQEIYAVLKEVLAETV